MSFPDIRLTQNSSTGALGRKQPTLDKSKARRVSQFRRLSEIDEKFLAPGYAASLTNLHGNLARYNGKMVHPKPTKISGSKFVHFLVELEPGELEIVVDNRYLQTVRDWRTDVVHLQQRNDESLGKTFTTGYNRSSAKNTMESLLAQMRAAMVKQTKGGKSLEDVFQLFERVGHEDQRIDKDEFLQGWSRMGVKIRSVEMDLVWPLFDSDGNGHVDLTEFKQFVRLHGTSQINKAGARITGQLNTLMQSTSSRQRMKRIESKTKLTNITTKLLLQLQKAIRAYAKTRRKTIAELFNMFDHDGGGSIDKNEFVEGLSSLDLKILLTIEQIDVIWPVMDPEFTGHIELPDFQRFMRIKPSDLGFLAVRDKVVNSLERNYDLNKIPQSIQMHSQEKEENCTDEAISQESKRTLPPLSQGGA